MDWKRVFMEQLNKETKEFADDSVFLKADGKKPDTLRLLFTIGEDSGNPAVMNVAIHQLDSELKLLQFYTIVETDVEEIVLSELMHYVNQLNFAVPLGFFCYYGENRQVYHKYSLIVNEPADMDAFVTATIALMNFILNILDSYCEGISQAVGRY